jgi:hypothetical protein
MTDSDEGEESEDEEVKVKKNIFAEITKMIAKEKEMNTKKQQKVDEDKDGLSKPNDLKTHIPNFNYNYNFESKYPNSRYLTDFEEIGKIGRGG